MINTREVIHIDSVREQQIKIRVCAYIRVSSDSDDQLNSYETQLNYYQNLINENQAWQMIDVYADEGISGQGIEKRTDFLRMLEDCKRGKIDRILTKSISRFARNTHDTITTVRMLKQYGVTIKFEKENIDTSNLQGEVLLTAFACFAQEELISISQNMKQANRMRMKRGEYVASSVPYGYQLIDKQLVIDTEQGEIIQRIFTEYLNGKGAFLISKKLMADRILSPTGTLKWTRNAVLDLLKNERFKGDMLLQKSHSPNNMFPLKQVRNKGDVAMYYVKNNHQPIISTEDFDKVQEIIKAKYNYNLVKYEHPLSKKVKCADCNSTFRRSNIKSRIYWACVKHNLDKNFCPVVQIAQDDIYDAFIRMYNKLKENYEYILIPMYKSLQKLKENVYRGNLIIEKLNKEIASLSEQSCTLNDLISQGVLDSALFISQMDELRRNLRKLKAEKSLQMSDDEDEMLIKTEELIATIEDGAEYLAEFVENIFADIVEKIIAYEDRTIGFILVNGLELKEKVNQPRR